MNIRTLDTIPDSVVHDAFVQAFSDYEVRLDLPLERFREMARTRDFDYARSLGWFEGDALAGFIVLGVRDEGGVKRAYDGGTGTVPEYRRRGIGAALLSELVERLRGEGFASFVLESLEHNAAAIDLYRKAGFKTTRRLLCFERAVGEIGVDLGADPSAWEAEEIGADDFFALDHGAFLSSPPSWQNEARSILNNGKHRYILLRRGPELLGYGAVHAERGDIPQIALRPEARNAEAVAFFASALGRHTSSRRLQHLNVPEGDWLGPALAAAGFANSVNQYEMVLDLPSMRNASSGIIEP